MSTSGGMGKEMDVLVRQIATKLSVKRGGRYSYKVYGNCKTKKDNPF